MVRSHHPLRVGLIFYGTKRGIRCQLGAAGCAAPSWQLSILVLMINNTTESQKNVQQFNYSAKDKNLEMNKGRAPQ